MKLANPLYYPLAVLAGAVALVVGVRVAKLPSVVMLPLAAAIATAGAVVLKSQQPKSFNLDNPELERELQAVRASAQGLADKANALQLEAARLLSNSFEIEVLASVQLACDRAAELPPKVDELARRMQGADSLLSVQELQQQLTEVQAKLQSSSGAAREQRTKLAESLRRNIQLARQGQDARQAQVASLSTLILDAAGVLQAIQNQLRTANLADSTQAGELRSLSDELRAFQENVDLLVSQ